MSPRPVVTVIKPHKFIRGKNLRPRKVNGTILKKINKPSRLTPLSTSTTTIKNTANDDPVSQLKLKNLLEMEGEIQRKRLTIKLIRLTPELVQQYDNKVTVGVLKEKAVVVAGVEEAVQDVEVKKKGDEDNSLVEVSTELKAKKRKRRRSRKCAKRGNKAKSCAASSVDIPPYKAAGKDPRRCFLEDDDWLIPRSRSSSPPASEHSPTPTPPPPPPLLLLNSTHQNDDIHLVDLEEDEIMPDQLPFQESLPLPTNTNLLKEKHRCLRALLENDFNFDAALDSLTRPTPSTSADAVAVAGPSSRKTPPPPALLTRSVSISNLASTSTSTLPPTSSSQKSTRTTLVANEAQSEEEEEQKGEELRTKSTPNLSKVETDDLLDWYYDTMAELRSLKNRFSKIDEDGWSNGNLGFHFKSLTEHVHSVVHQQLF